MEEKTIEMSNNMGRVRRCRNGDIRIESAGASALYLGSSFGNTAREFAHAILELIGDPVPSKGDDCYIAVTGNEGKWAYGKVVDGVTRLGQGEQGAINLLIETGVEPGEFHIFRRVATVSPIPQPERKVTRYE